MAEEYMQEQRVFMWRKLLLDQDSPGKIFHVRDFANYTNEEESVKEAIRLQSNDNNTDKKKNFEDYCYSSPLGAIPSLIQLTEKGLNCLKITEIRINKAVIPDYRRSWKRLVSMNMGRFTLYPHIKNSKREKNKYPMDPFCGLTEPIYNKVKNGKEFSIPELAEIVFKLGPSTYFQFLNFKIQVDKEKLANYLNNYIDMFMAGKLISPPGRRYFKFSEQKNNILNALQILDAKYDSITTNFSEIAQNGGWTEEDKSHYRFYETLFSLERLKKIKLQDLQKNEFTLTLIKDADTNEITETESPKKDRYLNLGETIELKTLDIKVEGGFMIYKKTKSQKINLTDRRLLNFLYLKFTEDKQLCFTKEVLAKELGLSLGNIKNRISFINQQVRGLITKKKTNIDDLIRYEGIRHGYRLNPRFMIQFTKDR